ncbi:MAG: FAD:protein FMN transferase [Deltaproteobacteria bacterium]|nr:FAD:protein FMN transferase [Deltaproteobacteria bacterium]
MCVGLALGSLGSALDAAPRKGDRFDTDQLRAFAHKETLAGNIEASSTIVALHKFEPQVQQVFDAAFADLRRVALLFDSSRPESDLSRVNAQTGGQAVQVSKEMVQLLALAKKMHYVTKGAFDIVETAGTTANDIKLDKGANTVRVAKAAPLRLEHLIDGYLTDLLLMHLWNANIDNILVQVGGAARSQGRDVVGPWRLTIADVAGRYAARGITLTFSNLAAATVGAGRRAPTLDFRTKQPLTPPCRGVTILSRDAATSLAIANAVYVLGPTAGMELANRLQSRAVIMDNAGNLAKSPGL